jgi:zinc D-Ala-D-Ala carboxypeptidase
MKFTADTWPKDRWPNFSHKEMACSHCGDCYINSAMMDNLQDIRNKSGPLTVTSGYRCPHHRVEVAKDRPGAHTFGKAVDIAVDREKAYRVLKLAYDAGFQGIGVKQHGEGRFLHLDTMTKDDGFPRPTLFSYP